MPASGSGAAADVVLVRHGETEWSRTGRHTGRTDVALEPSGRGQARRVGAELAGTRFERVLTSPLSRAVETATLAGFGDRAERWDELREWDYGDFEGRTTAQIREANPGWLLWTDGAPGGETPSEVGKRVDKVIATLREGPTPALVFAHGHVLRVLGARWVGLAPGDGRRLRLDPGAICALGYEREVPVIDSWNVG